MSGTLARFFPERLLQARLASALTGADLGARCGVTRQAIYSFERGNSKPSAETLRALAEALGVEQRFFAHPLRRRETAHALESAITFRKLASSLRKGRDQVETYLQWLAGMGEFVEQSVQIPPPALPDFGTDDLPSLDQTAIEDISQRTRRAFGLGDGPINDLTLLLENKGVLIGYVDLPSGLEGVSAWIEGRPTCLVNAKAYWARARFDLAHELGHLVLHRNVLPADFENPEIQALAELQAHQFAGSFLMPEAAIATDVYALLESNLIDAKQRWGVSMQAILMRLRAIGLINERQLRRAFLQIIGAKGYRRKEPLDGAVPAERGRLLKRVFEFMSGDDGDRLVELLFESGYPRPFVEQATGLVFLGKSSNVIQIHRAA